MVAGRARAASTLSGADPVLERFVEGVAGVEGFFEGGDADPLGAFVQKPAGELGDLAAACPFDALFAQ